MVQSDGIEVAAAVSPRYQTAPEIRIRSLHEQTGRRVVFAPELAGLDREQVRE